MIVWKNFPENVEEAYEQIPPKSPYVTLLKGGYQQLISGGGLTRTMWVYYPANMEYSCKSLTIMLPSDQTIDEFLASTGWIELAERENLMLLLTGGSSDPWTNDPVAETAFMDAFEKARNDRHYMDTQRAFSYFAAYGDAANLGHMLTVRYPARFASVALAGRIVTDEYYLSGVGNIPSKSEDIPLHKIPCPIAFATPQAEAELSNVLSYWKYANRAEDLPYLQDSAKIWLPDMSALESPIDHLPVARIMLWHKENPFDSKFTNDLWRFLIRTCRSTGILNDDLHPFRTAEQWGIHRQERDVDGYARHWYEYIPDRSQVLTDGKFPLVVFLHGGSASALSGLYSHEWVQVAKERGFILAMPTGTMRRMKENMPHPAWNASQDAGHMDDEKFLRIMISDIASRYPVDLTRIYINGHSMGSAMTQRVALAMPDLFAAAASNSGVIAGGFMGGVDLPGVREDLQMPMWIQMGENDVGGGTMENNPKAKFTVEYWLDRAKIATNEVPHQWRCGRYLNKEWLNKNGIPMVRYTTTLEKPHAITPQDPWMYYDQFLCHFSRLPDGTLLYKGGPIE